MCVKYVMLSRSDSILVKLNLFLFGCILSSARLSMRSGYSNNSRNSCSHRRLSFLFIFFVFILFGWFGLGRLWCWLYSRRNNNRLLFLNACRNIFGHGTLIVGTRLIVLGLLVLFGLLLFGLGRGRWLSGGCNDNRNRLDWGCLWCWCWFGWFFTGFALVLFVFVIFIFFLFLLISGRSSWFCR